MLRIYLVQQWFNLSDPGVEEALYDSAVLRQFVGIDLGQEPAPDETTVCKFRHLLEEHDFGGAMLEAVNQHRQRRARLWRALAPPRLLHVDGAGRTKRSADDARHGPQIVRATARLHSGCGTVCGERQRGYRAVARRLAFFAQGRCEAKSNRRTTSDLASPPLVG